MQKKSLFSRSSREVNVFLDERHLYPEFVPERLPHREKELDSLVYCFEPVLKGRKPLNVFLTGPTGVGKTVSVKYVLRELEDSFGRAKSLYLNCFEYGSRAAILSAIANFTGAAIPRRGLATDEIFSQMLESMRKCGFTPIVILDEVDQLLISEKNSKLLYDLLRIVEYEKLGIGLVMISNDAGLASKLDARIRSSLAQQTIVFDSYTPVQLKKILFERAETAFVKGAVSAEVIGVAAAHASKMGGDARVALESLLKAGRFCERRNSPEVSIDDLNEAFREADAVSALKGLRHLSKDELELLKIAAKNSPVASGKIYEEYSSAGNPLKERRLRDTLNSLEKKGFLVSEAKSLGNMGKTRVFRTLLPAKTILDEIAKLG